MRRHLLKHPFIKYAAGSIILLLIYIVLYKLYIPRVNAFGCFDDCFNYIAGYFLGQGRSLYTEVFFNHQPFPAYISYLIQQATKPINIYELVLRHRQFILLISFSMSVLLMLRFGFVSIVFALIYEFSKYYVFGDRFLGESMIIYPLVYLFGILWLSMQGKKVYFFDLILVAFFSWFILFTRLPYAPAVLFMLVASLVFLKNTALSKLTLGTIAILIFATLLYINDTSSYYFNIVEVNTKTIVASEKAVSGPLFTRTLYDTLYPLRILTAYNSNEFYALLSGIVVALIIASVMYVRKDPKKHGLRILLLILALGTANTRPVAPGTIFYEAFHMAPWYSLIIIITLFLIKWLLEESPKQAILPIGIFILSSALFVLNPQSFMYEAIDPHEQFMTYYGDLQNDGEVIKTLTQDRNSIFVDGFDDLIYWQSKRLSPYKYSWYTSVMPHFPLYTNARLDMFIKKPPDVYYGSCPQDTISYRLLPDSVKDDYIQLHKHDNPSCIYVHTDLINEISREQWSAIGKSGYTLPR